MYKTTVRTADYASSTVSNVYDWQTALTGNHRMPWYPSPSTRSSDLHTLGIVRMLAPHIATRSDVRLLDLFG